MFRKPKRSIRSQRKADDSDDEENGRKDCVQNSKHRDHKQNGSSAKDRVDSEDDIKNLKEIQSTISKFKEGKHDKKKKKTNKTSEKAEFDSNKKGSSGSTLSFEQELEGDDGEIFQVKKSSQSRRLIKQLKAEKKAARKYIGGAIPAPKSPLSLLQKENESIEDVSPPSNAVDMDIRIKGTISNKTKRQEVNSWTVSGREAEALHMEEEESDENSSEDEVKDPLQKMLQSGAIPDATAIHAARKKREALRAGGQLPENKSRSYIPLKDNADGEKKIRSPTHEDDDSDVDEARINFTGVRSAAAVKHRQLEELDNSPSGHLATGMNNLPYNEEDDHWEQQQIRKAIKASHLANVIGVSNNSTVGVSADPFHDGSNDPMLMSGGISSASYSAVASNTSKSNIGFGNYSDINNEMQHVIIGLKKPISYNLQGIKDRLKERLLSLKEVSSRHESDLDRAHDDMILSKMEIDKFEGCIPDMASSHRYYQDLRGYVTDLVECYDEKLLSIKYLEDKFYKSKSDITKKLIERRREDIRDQMKELSSHSKAPLLMNQDETIEEEARQRRAAEREGRRRRRVQQRKSNSTFVGSMKHADGMSSDDEMSSLEQSTLGKVRQDVENQARTVMSDVVEDFSSLECVCERLQQWREDDISAYTDAFVSMCLPKIFSALVRLQILFWNPLTEHNNIEVMPWYKTIATYAENQKLDEIRSPVNNSETSNSNGIKSQEDVKQQEKLKLLKSDPDSKLLSLVIEKVVIVRITNFVRSAYDPLSTTQTLKLTGLLERFIDIYPTVNGESRQVRELLEVVKEKLKSAIDNDVYIPIGYPKHLLENPLSGHSAFLKRQFWGAFKLYRNVLAWHGILSDPLVAEMALNSILNRYMVIGFNVMVSCGEYEPVRIKCHHVIGALPAPWKLNQKNQETNNPLVNAIIFKIGLQRFSKFLVGTFGTSNNAIPRKCIEDSITFLRIIGAHDESVNVERKLKERT